jgi:hypothetical protein
MQRLTEIVSLSPPDAVAHAPTRRAITGNTVAATATLLMGGLLAGTGTLSGAASKPHAPTKQAATMHFPANLYLKQLIPGEDIAVSGVST